MGYPSYLAGMAGFEPTNTRVKVWCLTAWRHPTVLNTPYIISFTDKAVKSKFTEFGVIFGVSRGKKGTDPINDAVKRARGCTVKQHGARYGKDLGANAKHKPL